MKPILLLSLLFLFSLSLSSNNIDILYNALTKLDYEEEIFSYESKTEVIGKDETNISIVVFDPKSEEPYKLKEFNGKIPTVKDIKKFKKNQKKGDNDTTTKDLFGSNYSLVSTENGIAQYRYTTDGNLIPKKESKMNGLVWLDLRNEYITKVRLTNITEIDITFGVSIKKFSMEFIFKPFNSEITVIDIMNMSIEGRAVVVDFEQVSTINMYNYMLVK